MTDTISDQYNLKPSAGNDPEDTDFVVAASDGGATPIGLHIDQAAAAIGKRVGIFPTGDHFFRVQVNPDSLVVNVSPVSGVDYDYWIDVVNSDVEPVYPTSFTEGQATLRKTLGGWGTEEWRRYVYFTGTSTLTQIQTADGTGVVIVTPNDTTEPTGILTLTAGANSDTEIDWSIAASDAHSGIDATLTELVASSTGLVISLGAASGTITGLNPSTEYTYEAKVYDNYNNMGVVVSKSLTTAANTNIAGSIEFTETGNPAYTVAEDVGSGDIDISLTLTGRTDSDAKGCTVSTRAWTTDGTSQVIALTSEPVSFAADADPKTAIVTVTLDTVAIAANPSVLNNMFEVYIDDGSANGATGGDPDVGANNAILILLTGSGTTGTAGYQDYDDGSRQLLFLTFDDNDWTETTGNKPGDGMSIDSANPLASTDAVTWDTDVGGLFVNIEPYDDSIYAESYNCPVTLSATGTWYMWAHMYTTGIIRSTLFSMDRNQINTNQIAKTTALSTEQWRPVGTATGSVPTGYSFSAGDHNYNIATREASTTHWVDGVILTDDAAFTPSGMAYTPSTKSTTEDAVDNPDNPGSPLGPPTTSKITPIFSPLDNATDAQTNTVLTMTFTGLTGLILDSSRITVTNGGGVAAGSWSTNAIDVATFTLDTGQAWTDGAAVTVEGTAIGTVVDTDGDRKSIIDLSSGVWNFTVTTPGTYIYQITFENVVNVPRRITEADCTDPDIFNSNDWKLFADGETSFVHDPFASGKGTVLEHFIPQGIGDGTDPQTGQILQTRTFDIVNPVGGAVMREVYHAVDIAVPSNYLAPNSVHLNDNVWSSPDHTTHGGTVPDDITPDKCKVGFNFYNDATWHRGDNALALYVYRGRLDSGKYGPFFMNDIDPTRVWAGSIKEGQTRIPLGRWFTLEHRVRLNTFTGGVANSDGIMQAWLDGKLVINLTNVMYIETDTTLGLNMITTSCRYGGAGAIAVKDDYIWRDNFRYATFPLTH